MAFVKKKKKEKKNCGPDLWRKSYRCVCSHLEESVQGSVLHELRYDHHRFTCVGTQEGKLLVEQNYEEEKKKKKTDYKETGTEK